MWLLTPFGFFSIVAHRENKHFVLVRARVARDALDFVSFIEGANGDIDVQPPSPIVETEDADYRFRFVATRRAIGHALSVFVTGDLEYDNFKNEVYRTQGVARANLYGHVWHMLREGLQSNVAADERPPPTRARRPRPRGSAR